MKANFFTDKRYFKFSSRIGDVHLIGRSGNDSITLCGIPPLSTNYAATKQDAEICPKCLGIFNESNNIIENPIFNSDILNEKQFSNPFSRIGPVHLIEDRGKGHKPLCGNSALPLDHINRKSNDFICPACLDKYKEIYKTTIPFLNTHSLVRNIYFPIVGTVGELKNILKDLPDDISFGFLNQPIQQLNYRVYSDGFKCLVYNGLSDNSKDSE